MQTAYKLFRVRKDGSIGSLFINPKAVLPIGVRLQAESHPTRGFAVRPGWHATPIPYAPHLSMKNRAWFEVIVDGVTEHVRPECQGGKWLLCQSMVILRKLD